MYPTLALLLVALAGFAVVVVRLTRPAAAAADPGQVRAREQLEGFGYVGAAALLLLAAAVVILGVAGFAPVADTVAVAGFFAYVIYVGVAYVFLTQLIH